MGNVQFNNNKVLFTTDSKVAMHGDCCCFVPDACEWCPEGQTPAAWIAVVSGVSWCDTNTCYHHNDHNASHKVYTYPSSGPNGTYILYQESAEYPCSWENAYAADGEIHSWTNDTCFGAGIEYSIEGLEALFAWAEGLDAFALRWYSPGDNFSLYLYWTHNHGEDECQGTSFDVGDAVHTCEHYVGNTKGGSGGSVSLTPVYW